MGTHRDPNDVRTLLVPLDGTAFSRKILDQVRELFTPDRFQIALLHVAAPPAGLTPPYHPAAVGTDYTLYEYASGQGIDEGARSNYQRHALYEGHAHDDYRERLQQELERELTLFRDEGYEASATVHFGDPATEIVAFARDTSIAAIAMATHGRRGIGRLLQGSVAQDVFARLDRAVPVLLLRPDSGGAQDEERAAVVRDSHRGAMGGDATHGDRTGPVASLAGLRGVGSMTVHRHDDGSLEEVTGTFSPEHDDADLAALRDAQRENLAVEYDGSTFDPNERRERVRRTNVFITRIREAQDDLGDSPEAARVEFVAGEVVDGDLVTQPSEL